MVTNVVMEVTPDLSERVQEIVFANGDCWPFDDEKKIKNLDKKYLFIDKNKKLTFDSSIPAKTDKELISACDFIASQGQQKWLPKYGEEALFSYDGGKSWYKKTFVLYDLKLTHYKYATVNGYYKHCKPLPPKRTITVDGKEIELSEDSYQEFVKQFEE